MVVVASCDTLQNDPSATDTLTQEQRPEGTRTDWVGETNVVFGVLADAQYCDCAPYQDRHYRLSLDKMRMATSALNAANVDFAVHLGDLIDRDFESFGPIRDAFNRLEAPTHHVLGNHEYSIEPERRADVLDALGLEAHYSSLSVGAWRFVFLDGNDLSLYATSPRSLRRRQASEMYAALKYANAPNAQKWNGGISQAQLGWLDHTLSLAQTQEQQVVIFSHFPIYPLSPYTLWNAEDVLSIIESYPNIAVYMHGHDHAGQAVEHGGVQHIGVQAMVETQQNAFAIVSLDPERIKIKGHGREPNRSLYLSSAPIDRVEATIALESRRAIPD